MKQIEIYKAENFQIEVQVQLENDTVWLSQKQMSDLYGKDSDTIGLHLKNIFAEKELNEKSTTGFFQVVQKESKSGTLQLQEAKGLLDIISNYTQSFVLYA